MTVRILTGDCRAVLATLPESSVQCCVTSPPYFGLRDYGHEGQIGLEQTPADYVEQLVAVFREVRRVLRHDGTLWLNLGDSYAGSWGAQGHGPSASASMSRHQIASHPKRAQQTGTIRAAGVKPKDLYGIPWRVAFALQADGWYLRQDIIWHKPNPMPESVTDRCTKAHEYVFLLSKAERYHFDADAIAEQATGLVPGNVAQQRVPGEREGQNANLRNGLHAYAERQRSKRNSFARETKYTEGEHGQKPQHRPDRDDIDYIGTRNKRSVWTIPTKPFSEAHFATMAPALAELCIKAGCPEGGTVLDPFGGAGTTGLVADQLQRDAVLVELNPDYAAMARRRITGDAPLFAEVAA
jgi:DNA modification methylase